MSSDALAYLDEMNEEGRIEYRPNATPHFEVIVTDLTHRSDAVDQLTKERLT